MTTVAIRAQLRTRGGAIPLASARARSSSIPAPVGGWNTRDSLADMSQSDATILDNWFPRLSDVKIRGGYTSHATGLVSPVEALMPWNGPSSSKYFAAAGANIYNITNAGAVGAADVASLTSARWQSVNFGTSAGAFLYLVNGADAPRYYDGTSWTVPTITGSGLTASNLVSIAMFKRRLLFCENNKLGFWYFPVETLAGAISYFDLSPLCARGGYLMAIGTWTRDGGAGLDDFAVFFTSNGEIIVYQGSNPADASAWSLVGVFNHAIPIGRRCLTKYGSDLLVLTQDGFTPLSVSLINDRLSQRQSLSTKIQGAAIAAVTDHRSKFGWQSIQYPRGNMLIVNVPTVENSTAEQYVMNTTTSAWCRFTAQNANVFGMLGDNLYFGGSGAVYKADSGLNDNGANITGDAQTAYSYLRQRGTVKNFKMARPILATDGTLSVAMEAMVDYATHIPTITPSFTAPTSVAWDDGVWDVSAWSDVEQIIKSWQTISGTGYAVALRMRTVSKNGTLRWLANDVLWEPGGPI